MTEWNDGRLDDLNERVDRIETKMDAGFARLDKKMDDGFAVIGDKFDELHRMLFKAAWGLCVGLLGLVGVMATQL
ncbi:MAG TPA: hypothetical protein VN732_00700 [Solirubrobacterales bacterium]|nr:hypothetical protein [Solirubrobacterales bacterium]